MRWSNSRAPLCAALALLAASPVVGCSTAPLKVAKAPARVEPKVPPQPPLAAPVNVLPMLPTQLVAQLDDESVAPYFARRGADGLVLYTSHGRWMTRAVGADGAPKGGAPIDAAPVGEMLLAAVRPAGDGYLAVWAEVVAKNALVKVLALDLAGKPLGEATVLTQSPDEVATLDVLPNGKGALVAWEVRHEDRSDLSVAPVVAGKVTGPAVVAVHDCLGWEAIATERGAAIATVAVVDGAPGIGKGRKAKPKGAQDPQDGGGTKLGRVYLTEVDPTGKASAAVAVSDQTTAQMDVGLTEVDGRYVLAWTDEREIDAAVFLASVDPGGRVAVAPRRATSAFGEQALVSLTASGYAPGAAGRGHRALLAWEDLLGVPRQGRLIHLASVASDATLAPERATLVFTASGRPDIAADGDGFAAVTLAPAALGEPGGQAPAKDAPVLPTYVRFGPDLSVVAAEPVRGDAFAATDGIPYLTRSLGCQAGACTSLANAAGPNAPLGLVSLPIRQSPWWSPAWREADEAPPRATAVTALFDGDHLARVAATDLPGGGALAAWVTFYLEGSRVNGGKRAPKTDDGPSATLGVRAISANGTPGKTVIVSHKALSVGGVAVAVAPGPKPETAIAWVAKVKGEPQVFITTVSPDGTRISEKGVTIVSRKVRETEKGVLPPPSEASDVALAYAGGGDGNDGWVVAWVDTRDGNPEIYVAKVDRSLKKIVPDRRVTVAAGDSSDVALAVRGKDVLLAWSDTRQNPEEGNGDIYLARLDLRSLTKTGNESRIFASALNSRSPAFAPLSRGFLLSWIEEPGDGKRGEDATSAAEKGLRVAQLDESGSLVGSPQLIRGDGQGTVTSSALACGPKACRGVLTSTVGETLVLDAFELTPGSVAGPLKAIAALTGRPTADVSPSFANPAATSLFFTDDAAGGAGRVRWMQIAW